MKIVKVIECRYATANPLAKSSGFASHMECNSSSHARRSGSKTPLLQRILEGSLGEEETAELLGDAEPFFQEERLEYIP